MILRTFEPFVKKNAKRSNATSTYLQDNKLLVFKVRFESITI